MDLFPPRPGLRIDCDECALRGTSTCTDCVVTFLCDRDDAGVVVIAPAEVRVLHLLHDAGLAPALRHEARDQPSVAHRMVRSCTAQGP